MSFDLHTVKMKPHLLTISQSIHGRPMITISGAWLSRWGFTARDHLSIYFVRNGYMLLNIEPILDPETRPYDCQQTPIAVTSLPVLKNRLPHSLTISGSCRYCPQIKISGAWLRNWGFFTGDRICVTKEADGILSIDVVAQAEEWVQLKKTNECKREQVNTLSILKKYKAQYPVLFEQVANSKKRRPAQVKPLTPVQPVPYDHKIAIERHYSAAVAEHLAEYKSSA